MCGIAGFWGPPATADAMRTVLEAQCDAMRHRGPDAQAHWTDQAAGLGLAHARLSIIDLSPAGSQPMAGADGRLVITYNGEIYNYMAIRRELERTGLAPAQGWRGHSDTELLLEAMGAWGLEEALARCVGMFALAVWDTARRRLHLVRDRLGIKPLYYGYAGNSLVFGSTPGALRRHPDVQSDGGGVDKDALCAYLRTLYVPAPLCIYKGMRQLEPGRLLTVTADDLAARRLPEPTTWWSLRTVAEAGQADLFTGSEDEAATELDALLADAVGLRMIADVPLGAFLSGGVDSSTVAALMQEHSARPVKTFTIGSTEADYDESGQAAAVARHLQTEHTFLRLTPAQARECIPLMPRFFDEPFADASQIPTYLVSRLARDTVTVSLSGDGGDELFGGYNRHVSGPGLWRRLSGAPRPLRAALAMALAAGLDRPAAALLELRQRRLPPERREHILRDKLQKFGAAMSATGREDFYRRLCAWWPDPATVVNGGSVPPTMLDDEAAWPAIDDFAQWMMTMDLGTYLPGDILTKVDRASMAVSLEARVPLLDHRVVEFAHRLPMAMKIAHGRGKHLLRKVLHKRVPMELVERPKQGFGVPMDAWLRGPLRDWAEQLLDEGRLRREGFLRPEPVRRAWRDHLSGRANRQYHLWGVLMFQAWLEEHTP